jgi:hypothetical protein
VAPPLEKPAGLTRAHAAGWNLTKNNGMAGNCYRDSENLIVGCRDSHCALAKAASEQLFLGHLFRKILMSVS